jgi:hypothetical protein
MNNEYLYHVVLISFFPDTNEKIREEIIKRYSTLGDDCGGKSKGILFWSAKPNLDLRKDINLVQVSIFKNEKAFNDYKKHSRHIETIEYLKLYANWYVGDVFDFYPEQEK